MEKSLGMILKFLIQKQWQKILQYQNFLMKFLVSEKSVEPKFSLVDASISISYFHHVFHIYSLLPFSHLFPSLFSPPNFPILLKFFYHRISSFYFPLLFSLRIQPPTIFSAYFTLLFSSIFCIYFPYLFSLNQFFSHVFLFHFPAYFQHWVSTAISRSIFLLHFLLIYFSRSFPSRIWPSYFHHKLSHSIPPSYFHHVFFPTTFSTYFLHLFSVSIFSTYFTYIFTPSIFLNYFPYQFSARISPIYISLLLFPTIFPILRGKTLTDHL